MKKSVLFALAAMTLGAAAATAQEVTYVEDCSQGTLINRNKDNWFITAEGGTNVLFGKDNSKADLKDRFGGNAGLYLGKWVTPNFGFRFGAHYLFTNGATKADGVYRNMAAEAIEGKPDYYPERMQAVGPEFDVLINLTNWWCGYKPNRVYNAVLHGGGGVLWTFARKCDGADARWRSARTTPLFVNMGLQNNFRLGKGADFFIDVQYELFRMEGYRHFVQDVAVNVGFNFYLSKREWNCPVTAVCPTWKYTDAEGDALVARLAQADNKIKDLQAQLDACLKRPVQKVVKCEGLATIYYPINQYGLSNREKTILKSMAQVMLDTPNQKYVLTGWADNYTGTEEINTRLRNQRVDGVKNFLMKCGVPESQLDARIDAANLTDFGAKGAPLDRAVTIKLAD